MISNSNNPTVISQPSAGASAPSPAKNLSQLTILEQAKQVLEIEIEGIKEICQNLDESFTKAIKLLLECQGKVIVTGMGKSGHIGNKIAATLASAGTPSFFVHAAELHHGDFGAIDNRDLVLAISSSGETTEIKLALDPIKRLGLKIIALTGNPSSTLAKFADTVLNIGVSQEACPLNMVPTASTTAALAMGDALAIVLMTAKGFGIKDFVKSHPGGSLGKQLLTVDSIMRRGVSLPKVFLDTNYSQILTEIGNKKLGFTAVCDHKNKLIGVITDGDLRRAIVKYGQDVFSKPAVEIMTKNPKTIAANSLAVEALHIMEQYTIADLLITDENNSPVGVIDLKDLLKAGVI